MHGRPRKAPTPEEEKALALKAAKLRPSNLTSSIFITTKFYMKEALEVNAKLLEANPEYLTARNYRKFAVEHILSHSETDTEIDPDSIKSIYSEELRTERALAKNYRSYGAWYHRKWVLRKIPGISMHGITGICGSIKEQIRCRGTTRIFGWSNLVFIFRFVAALKNRLDAEEPNFTTDLINENFSNYSSWHNRRKGLKDLSQTRKF
ncbi:unnamed protein product [Camellia sinensis]